VNRWAKHKKLTYNVGKINKEKKFRLFKLLIRRPTLSEVRKKGIIKDLYFGCTLESLCLRESSKFPNLVKHCVEYLEKNDLLKFPGIYRLSGSFHSVRKLQYEINHGGIVDFNKISKAEKAPIVTSLLKLFLNELPVPLIPAELFTNFLYNLEADKLSIAVSQLPYCHKETLLYLLRHLARVVEYSHVNMMTTSNLAIIFGPTLIGTYGVHALPFQQRLIEKLIENVCLLQ
jgi:hypothetical protein